MVDAIAARSVAPGGGVRALQARTGGSCARAASQCARTIRATWSTSSRSPPRCLIVGGRQSAFEWAALMSEAGAAAIHVSSTATIRRRLPESDWSWVNPLRDRRHDDKSRMVSPAHPDREGRTGSARLFSAEGRLKFEPWLALRVRAPRSHALAQHPPHLIALKRPTGAAR